MAQNHPFTFPQAGVPAASPKAPPPATPTPPAPPSASDDGFFSGIGAMGAGAQKLPNVTPGDYPKLRIDQIKRSLRWDGEKMVIVEFTVLEPAKKTDPLFDPLLEGSRFSQLFFVRHAPAFSSLANLLAVAFNAPASSVTVNTLQQLLPQITPKGEPAAPCVLNGAGVEVAGLFYKRGDSDFCSVNWRGVAGRAYPDVVAASAAQG